LWFRNTTTTPLHDVVLRLYPNAPQDSLGAGGNLAMTVSDVVAQGVLITTTYDVHNTVVRVPLSRPAAPNELITLTAHFRSNIVPWRDDTYTLPSFFPMLAAWDNGWRTDLSSLPDKVYADSALYHAQITVPRAWDVISTGTIYHVADHGETRTFALVTGPVRDVLFSVGHFTRWETEHDGIKVVVWHARNTGLEDAAQHTLTHMTRSLATYNQRFGPYPYRTLECVLINDPQYVNFGAEYPQLFYVFSTGEFDVATRYIVAHEVAHQWFYNLLGSDVVNAPWIDEAFAQYSPYLVEEAWNGPSAAASYYAANVTALAQRSPQYVGLPAESYGGWDGYHRAVYGGGAQFVHMLRRELGDEAFFRGIQRFIERNKYRTVQRADVLHAMEEASGQDLRTVFQQWLGSE
jgi:aminopeptidase N